MRHAVLAAAVLCACSSSRAGDRPAPAPPPASQPVDPAQAPAVAATPAPTPGSAAAPPTQIPTGFSADCVAYATLIDRLDTCDQVRGARDGLRQGYLALLEAWPATPVGRRSELTAQCRTQAESLRNAAAAACHW
jgi:hypothetical protein